MPETPVFVLDSFAVLAHLQGEGKRVLSLLEQAQCGECRLLFSLINLGEVIYLVERRRGLPAAQAVLAALDELPVEVLPADREAVLAAAHLKAQFPIAYSDAFAASAAQTHQATLVTGDQEFERLAQHINIEWLEH
jgi:predicted nucleic acid-binding protein